MSNEVTEDPSSPAARVGIAAADRGKRSRGPRTAAPGADDHPGVSRLYTVAMMADVLRVPRATVRHWLRRGLLAPARRSGSVVWCEFSQLVVGRQLVRLLRAGLSLRDIDTQLAGLAPGGAAEAARAAERVVADGRRLSLRCCGGLLGAGGQLQFDFYTRDLGLEPPTVDDLPAIHSFVAAAAGRPADERATGDGDDGRDPGSVSELLDLAADLESQGAFSEAAEALRAVLQTTGPTPQVVFMLAELLYRAGDLTAARERYYAAIELDANHLEARLNLGCVLAELGEHELALAALDGVLRQEPEYADAHWHIAGLLRTVGREGESRRHLRMFLRLAPESPWATTARERLTEDAPLAT